MALTARQSNDSEDDSLDSSPKITNGGVANDKVEVDSVKNENDTTKIKLEIPTIVVPIAVADTDNDIVKTAATAALGALATDLLSPAPETEPKISPTPIADEHAHDAAPTEEITPTPPAPADQDIGKTEKPAPATKIPSQPSPKQTTTPPEKSTTPPTDQTTPLPNQPTAKQTEPDQQKPDQPETKPPTASESPAPVASKEDTALPPPTDEQYKKNERLPKKLSTDQSTSAEPTPPHSTTPPIIPKEELGKTGPHPTTTPSTLPPETQNDTASKLAQSKSWGGRMKDNVASGAQRVMDAPKKALTDMKNKPREIVNNIKSNFESERNKTRQLRQERRTLETELAQLENKINGVNISNRMHIIRFWFPGIYASISGFGAGMSNLKGQAKVAMLQTKLLTAHTIKGLLKTAESVSALIEANITVISWIVETIETVILPILIILVYPFLIIIMWIFITFMNAIGAPITKSIKELGKQVDEIIKGLENVLEPENKKLKTRRKIQLVNQMLASKNARNTLENPSQQPTDDKTKDQPTNSEIEPDKTQPNNSQQAI